MNRNGSSDFAALLAVVGPDSPLKYTLLTTTPCSAGSCGLKFELKKLELHGWVFDGLRFSTKEDLHLAKLPVGDADQPYLSLRRKLILNS